MSNQPTLLEISDELLALERAIEEADGELTETIDAWLARLGADRDQSALSAAEREAAELRGSSAEAAAVQAETRRSDDWMELCLRYRTVLVELMAGNTLLHTAQLKASLLDKEMDRLTK